MSGVVPLVLGLFIVLVTLSLISILEDLVPYTLLFDPIRFMCWKRERETECVRLWKFRIDVGDRTRIFRLSSDRLRNNL